MGQQFHGWRGLPARVYVPTETGTPMADPATYCGQGVFQSAIPGSPDCTRSSGPLLELTTVTTSPGTDASKNACPLSSERFTHPWETFSCPCLDWDQGAEWTKVPDQVSRTSQLTVRSYQIGALSVHWMCTSQDVICTDGFFSSTT